MLVGIGDRRQSQRIDSHNRLPPANRRPRQQRRRFSLKLPISAPRQAKEQLAAASDKNRTSRSNAARLCDSATISSNGAKAASLAWLLPPMFDACIDRSVVATLAAADDAAML